MELMASTIAAVSSLESSLLSLFGRWRIWITKPAALQLAHLALAALGWQRFFAPQAATSLPHLWHFPIAAQRSDPLICITSSIARGFALG